MFSGDDFRIWLWVERRWRLLQEAGDEEAVSGGHCVEKDSEE